MTIYGMPLQDFFGLCLLVTGMAGTMLISLLFLSFAFTGRNNGKDLRRTLGTVGVYSPTTARNRLLRRDNALAHRKQLREVGLLGQCSCELCRDWSLMCQLPRAAAGNKIPTTAEHSAKYGKHVSTTTSQASSITEST